MTVCRTAVKRLLAVLPLILLGLCVRAEAQDRVRFGIDGPAEAAYGGYYQAVANGFYARQGLEVTIRQGGPAVNQAQLPRDGRLDFALAGDSLVALDYARADMPYVAVAALFQRVPAVLIAHAGAGDDTLAALRGKPIMIGDDARAGWWSFLRARYGFSDRQIRPYSSNLQPFLTNGHAIQQGSLMSEPFTLANAMHQAPVVLLLADAGYDAYGSLIEASRTLIARDPGLVRRFVDASIEGWYSYLYTDPGPGDRLMMEANPALTQPLLTYGREVMRKYGIVDSGDAERLGIGAMSDARWAAFAGLLVARRMDPASLDWKAAFTTRFVDQRVGLAK